MRGRILLKHKLDSLGVPAVLYRLPLWLHTIDMIRRANDFAKTKWRSFSISTSDEC